MGPWKQPGDGIRNHRPQRPVTPGEVVEWLMAPVLKTGEVKASVGSNPTLSVTQRARDFLFWLGSRDRWGQVQRGDLGLFGDTSALSFTDGFGAHRILKASDLRS